MHRAAYVAVVLVAMLAPPTAQASLRVPLPANVTIIYGPCPDDADATGCTYSDRTAIAAGAYGDACRNPNGCIYLTSRDRFALYHELGHAWERQNLDDTGRAWYARRMGRAGEPWLTHRDHDPSPGEWFADVYANCAVGNGLGHRRNRWETGYGLNLSQRRYVGICNGFAMLAHLQRAKGVER